MLELPLPLPAERTGSAALARNPFPSLISTHRLMSPKSPISYPWHITIDDCTPPVLPCVLIERSVSQHNLILDVRFAARYWRQHPHLRDTCPQTLRALVHGYFLAQALHLDNYVLSSFDAVESSMHLAFFFFSLHLVFSLKVMMSLRHGGFFDKLA